MLADGTLVPGLGYAVPARMGGTCTYPVGPTVQYNFMTSLTCKAAQFVQLRSKGSRYECSLYSLVYDATPSPLPSR